MKISEKGLSEYLLTKFLLEKEEATGQINAKGVFIKNESSVRRYQ